MKRDQKTYVSWLNNAYAQEIAMAKMYTMHAKDVKQGLNVFPELAKKLAAKAVESREHADLMASCLKRHRITPHPAKTALGWIMGLWLGFTGDVTIDKVIMNDLTDQGMAQFEVGAYTTLIAAAQAMNDTETVTICQRILKQEQATVTWLQAKSGPIAREFLRRTGS